MCGALNTPNTLRFEEVGEIITATPLRLSQGNCHRVALLLVVMFSSLSRSMQQVCYHIVDALELKVDEKSIGFTSNLEIS